MRKAQNMLRKTNRTHAFVHFLTLIIVILFTSVCHVKGQSLYQDALISSGGTKSDSPSFSNFGILGAPFSSGLIVSTNYKSLNGFLTVNELQTDIEQKNLQYSDIQFYPNPTLGLLFYNEAFDLQVHQIEIYNSSGVKIREFIDKTDLNISDLAPGLYYFKVFDNKGICISVNRVVKF